MYLIAEVFHNAGDSRRAVDEDEAEAAVGVIHAQAGQDVGARSFADSNDVAHAQIIHHFDQPEGQRSQVRVLETGHSKQSINERPVKLYK